MKERGRRATKIQSRICSRPRATDSQTTIIPPTTQSTPTELWPIRLRNRAPVAAPTFKYRYLPAPVPTHCDQSSTAHKQSC